MAKNEQQGVGSHDGAAEAAPAALPSHRSALDGVGRSGVPAPAPEVHDLNPTSGHATGRPAKEWLTTFAGLERRDLWVVAVYSVVIGLLSLVVPVTVQALVTNVGFGQVLQPIVALTIVVALLLGFAGILKILQFRVLEYLQRRVFVRVALELAERLPRARRARPGEAYGPELVNRFFDVITLQKAGTTLILDGLELFLQLGVGMVLLAFYHPLLLAFVLVLVASVGLVFVIGRKAPLTAINESHAKYAVVGWLEELARHPHVFKSSGALAHAVSRTERLVKHWVEARDHHFRIVWLQFAGSVGLQAFMGALLLGLGGTLVIQRQLTLGQLVAAELVVTAVLASVAKLGKHLETYYDLLAAASKVGHLLEVPTERSDGFQPSTHTGPMRLTLHGVRFGYAQGNASSEVLRGVDLDLAPGGRVAITGSLGGGRSTLADIVFGLLSPTSGVVLVDGVDLRELSLESVRRHIALVREGAVFEGTVYDNVAVGRPYVDEQDVRDALRTVGLLEKVHSLPRGVHTPLAPTGDPLAGGNVSRLLVARAIAGKPRLILLDDVMGTLAPHERAPVLQAVLRPDAPWSVIVFSNKPDVLSRCSLAFELRHGVLSTYDGGPLPETAE